MILSQKIREKIQAELSKGLLPLIVNGQPVSVEKKASDHSYVTGIDTYISGYFEKYHKKNLLKKKWTFLSEEGPAILRFPCLILDPLDGTRELVEGVPECALSLALFESKKIKDSFGWIYNPFSGLSVSSDQAYLPLLKKKPAPFLGFVSRSEWKKGLFADLKSTEIIVAPRGSIANKLALLAVGACDFVVTLRPKNIWDIAAGTAICSARGIHLFSAEKEVKNLNEVRFSAPLIWCRPDLLPMIKKFLSL